jgi:GNAT superfamily N-acetyltransferase
MFILPWLGRLSAAEPHFIAVVPDPARPGGERAVGYIVGHVDSAAQEGRFSLCYKPRILARLVLYSWWRHPESFRQVLRFWRTWKRPAAGSSPARPAEGAASGSAEKLPASPAYGAQLHTNLLPEWQGKGLGKALMLRFLDDLRRRGVPGVELHTADRNLKALPFYEKLGFRLVEESPPDEAWKGLPAKGLRYALSLAPAEGLR